jgi:hypothetical protein
VDQIFTAPFWHDQWAVVMSAPWIIIPLLLLSAIIGSRWRKTVDDGEIRGLKAQKQAAEDRLQLAADKQTVVTEKIDEVKEQVSLISRQIQGRTIPVPNILAETEKLSGTIGDLSLANTEVSGTLSASGALYKTILSRSFPKKPKG